MKHRILILGIAIITAYACSQESKEYTVHTINLKNNLGELTISLPLDFDTVYTWTKYGDNTCADFEMFRFANKKYSLLQENGEWCYQKPDSLYQLTIVQSKYLDCENTTIIIDNELLDQEIENYRLMNPLLYSNPFIKEIRTINERNFMIIGFNYQGASNCISKLFLYTKVNGHFISLEFICQSKDCTDFISRIEKSINSIKIN